MDDVCVRQATRSDAVVVAALNDHVHELHVAAEPYDFRPTERAEVAEFFAFILDSQNHMVLLACINDV